VLLGHPRSASFRGQNHGFLRFPLDGAFLHPAIVVINLEAENFHPYERPRVLSQSHAIDQHFTDGPRGTAVDVRELARHEVVVDIGDGRIAAVAKAGTRRLSAKRRNMRAARQEFPKPVPAVRIHSAPPPSRAVQSARTDQVLRRHNG
jgi:hypothetical protein